MLFIDTTLLSHLGLVFSLFLLFPPCICRSQVFLAASGLEVEEVAKVQVCSTCCVDELQCVLSISFPHGHCWQRGRIQPCLIRYISQMWILRSISVFHRRKNIRFLACMWANILYGHRVAYIVNKLFTEARRKSLPGIFTDMMDFSKLNIMKRFSFKGSGSHHSVLCST